MTSPSVHIRIQSPPAASYSVRFCDGPGDIARRLARISGGSRTFIVTDRTVDRLHGTPMRTALHRAGVDARWLKVAPGERSKSRRVRDALEDRMIRAGAERGSLIVAFGGGVVGDLAGFVAATLFRGVRFLQVPTTFVSQADSAIGGKVGIDHPLGKNLLGAFHHPEEVLTDPAYLRTLPAADYLQGIAEAVKTAIVLDRAFALRLRRSSPGVLSRRPPVLRDVIARCCTLKGRVVRADERESGHRRILNFGHTIGHALEQASRYRLSHGTAVAIGMASETRIARRLGLIPARDAEWILSLLALYGLPVRIPGAIHTSDVVQALGFDKKREGGIVGFTLPAGIGRAVCGVPVPAGVIEEALRR